MHGHPWARILNKKFEKQKQHQTRTQKLHAKIFRKESDQEEYFTEFFKGLNKQYLELKPVYDHNIGENNFDPIMNDNLRHEQCAV